MSSNGAEGGTVVGHIVIPPKHYLKRAEACKMLHCSTTKLNALAGEGKIHPTKGPDGSWRYDPQELEAAAIELGIELDDESSEEVRRNAYARVDLNNSIRLMKLVVEPRERLDTHLFATIDRYAARIKELEDMLTTAYRKQQEAEDRTADRHILETMVQQTQARWTEVFGRLMGHVDTLFKGSGTPFLHSLTDQQMAMLLSVREDFTPEQREALDAAAKHNADKRAKEASDAAGKSVAAAAAEAAAKAAKEKAGAS